MRLDQLSEKQKADRDSFIRSLQINGWSTTEQHEEFDAGGINWIDTEFEIILNNIRRVVSLSHEYEACTLDIEFPEGTLTLSFPIDNLKALINAITESQVIKDPSEIEDFQDKIAKSKMDVDIALDGDYIEFNKSNLRKYLDEIS